jgi:myo-inositol-1-phosphate synthase
MCDSVVVINLASTEKLVAEGNEIFNSLAGFEKALDENSPDISPAMLYAYAAMTKGFHTETFTPSVAADIPALIELADLRKVPIAGKDGKTGTNIYQVRTGPGI